MIAKNKMIENTSISHGEFRDVDHFVDAVKGWGLNFIQLSPGGFLGDLTYATFNYTHICSSNIKTRLKHLGESPEGHKTFAFSHENSSNFTWKGKLATSSHLLNFNGNREYKSVTDESFKIFTLSVKENKLEEAADRLGKGPLNNLIPEEDMMKCPEFSLRALRKYLARHTKLAQENPEVFQNPEFLEDFEKLLAEKLLLTLESCKNIESTRDKRYIRKEALKRATRFIQERAHEPIPILELERLCKVSGRTLRYAFIEEYGVSPKQYLQAYRLHRVHKTLRKSHPTQLNVGEIAKTWGFEHMSQFAQEYKRMYKELPSDTLKRAVNF